MKSYLKLIGILILPLAFILYYAYSPVQIPPPGWKLTKLQLPTTPQATENKDTSSSRETRETRESRESRESRETRESRESRESRKTREAPVPHEVLPDSSAHRILFFGDSMVEGLLRRMNCYAFANGYQMTNVVWYSSTTEIWAQTDTLRYFLDKAEPTFVMISIGANEQFIKDAAGRETYIRQILRELGDTPFVWIGVPAWKEDTGINDLTKRVVGESRYFDSRGLTLQRGRDRMHPTFNAASHWMDLVAEWMSGPSTAHPIRMDQPTDGKKHTYKTYALQPLNNWR